MTPHSKPTIQSESWDVMAVGAHPDDVEIACGGTLARLAELGYRVGIVDLTNGEPTPNCPDPQIREAEAQAAARVLGVCQRIILNLPNRRLFDTFEARVTLARELRRFRPRIVLGFGEATPLASPDHWQAALITDAAAFYSRLTKWEEFFDRLPPHRVERQLYYRFTFESPGSHPSRPEFIMDIGQHLERKLQSIACYATQFPEEKKYVFDRVRAAALLAGSQAGCHAGEVFASPRPLVARDLVQFLHV